MPGDRGVLALSDAVGSDRLRPGVRRIAVLRALPGLGDLLCAVPALRALRAAAPDARVTLIGLTGAGRVPQVFPSYVDDLLVLGGWPGLREAGGTAADASRFLGEARARAFDLAVQLHGDGSTSNLLVGLLGARRVVGTRRRPGPPPPAGVFVEHRATEHEVHRLLRVVEAAGATQADDRLEWPTPGPLPPEVGSALPRGRPFLCVHPGASAVERRWPVEGFRAVAERLLEGGWGVVVTGGAAERGLTAEVAAAGPGAADLGGRTSLDGLASLLACSAGLVCNDTGVSHLAAALGVPSVVLCPPGQVDRWAPLDRDRHRVLAADAHPPTPAVVAQVVALVVGGRRPDVPGAGVSPARAAPASGAGTCAAGGRRASG